MPDIAKAGIVSIDFTGGEPTLLMTFLERVTRAASQFGITCGIVTAAHWANTERQANQVARQLGEIDHWDISTDTYHTEFVPLSAVERAYTLLRSAGKSVIIRIAHHEPITYEDAVLIDRVMRFADRNVSFQPIGPVGRGGDLTESSAADSASFDKSPCPTTGPLIQWNGRVAPCCAPASHEAQDHALWIGSTQFESIVDLIGRWRTDALLQTMRLWGFGPLREWFAQAGVSDSHALTTRTCDTCVKVLRDPRLMEIAVDRANELDHRIRVAHALLTEFDEPWLDDQLRCEAQEYLRNGEWPAPRSVAA
jgi:hypothetical protein